MSLMPTFLQQGPVIGGGFTQSSFLSSTKVSVKFTISCCTIPSPMTHVNGNVDTTSTERSEIRLGLPSKGRMATDTLDLLNVYSQSLHNFFLNLVFFLSTYKFFLCFFAELSIICEASEP